MKGWAARRNIRSLGLSVVMVIVALPAAATTYYVDGVDGDDGVAGTSRGAGAWRTWAKMLAEIDAGTVTAGDTVLIRPGRYWASDGGGSFDNWRIDGPAGGTVAMPITISVDTFYEGDVEISGSVPGGFNTANGYPQDRSSDWVATTDGHGHTVYYTVSNDFYLGHNRGPGVAFQPGAQCVGGANHGGWCSSAGDCPNGSCSVVEGADPTLFEVLYSPDVVPIAIPAFTPGRNQCWVSLERTEQCGGPGTPWACCTGVGTGSCSGERRVYVQTAGGAAPDAISPPVEIPFHSVLDIGLGGIVEHIRFTNNDNGRTLHLRWGVSNVMVLRAARYLVFEDFDLGYNSSTTVWPPGQFGKPAMESGSGFPRNNGGPTYLIHHAAAWSSENHHVTYRRGRIHHAAGDEAVHMDCPNYCATAQDVANAGRHLFEDMEFAHTPWEVANETPVYPGGGAYAWPPPGYDAAWATTYPTHYSPLGGGSQSPGPWIIAQPYVTMRRMYVHSSCGVMSFEQIYSFGHLIEDSVFDGAMRRFLGGFSGTPYPPCPTATCSGGPAPDWCAGFGGGPMFVNDWGSPDDVPGNVYRNNLILNVYGPMMQTFGNDAGGRYEGFQFVNNTVQIKGDGDYISGRVLYIPWMWGSAAQPALIKNNILFADGATSSYTVLVDSGAVVDFDRNLYSPSNIRWNWFPTLITTDLGLWQSTTGQDATSFRDDPLFVSPGSDLHLRPSSPAVDVGLDLEALGFSTDVDGDPRPFGPAWDIGADELISGVIFADDFESGDTSAWN